MLIEPASKVSVPLTVVRRIRSSDPVNDLSPPTTDTFAFEANPRTPEKVQIFDPIAVKTTLPESKRVPDHPVLNKRIPAPRALPTVAVPLETKQLAPTYPLVSTLPAPICNCGKDVPLVLTPRTITVTRFTHDGMLVKSILVPLVDATAVPEVMPRIAPELIVTLAEPSITVLMPMSPR